MISSQKFRPCMQITLADIFQDYNDPRKETLSKRVALALEDQEKRLKCELDANNLTNLQILLKKQQTLKGMEEKLNEKSSEIEELKQKLEISVNKVQELQSDLIKRVEMNQGAQEKIKDLNGAIKNLEALVKNKNSLHQNLQKEKNTLISQNERLESENQKYQKIINTLRQNYSQKIQETQYVLKIKHQQMTQQFNENLQHIKTKATLQKERKQIDNKFASSPKMPTTKNQRIQCTLLPLKQSPRKRPEISCENGVQTQPNKDQAISELIDQNKPSEKNQNLDEVRLIFSRTPVMSESPLLTKYLAVVLEDKNVQTDPVNIQAPMPLKFHKEVQAQFQIQNQFLKEELRKEQQKVAAQQEANYHKQVQLVSLYKERQEDQATISILKLKILEIELQLDKRNQEISMEREVLSRANKHLETNQNELILRKLSGNTSLYVHKPKLSKTCGLLYTINKNSLAQSSLTLNKRTHPQQTSPFSPEQTIELLSPRKWQEQEANIITIIRKAHKLKYFKNRKRSMTESNPSSQSPNPSSLFVNRNYTKYSQFRKK